MVSDPALLIRLATVTAEATVACATALDTLYPELRVAMLPLAGGYAIFAGVDSVLSSAVGLGVHKEVTADDLDQLEVFYEERGGCARIEIFPSVDSGLIQELGKRGYQITGTENVLVRALQRDESFPLPRPPLEIEEVRAADIPAWATVVGRGFVEDEAVPEEYRRLGAMFGRVPEATCFLARRAGEPAAGGVVDVRRGIAGLCFGSTLRPFRREGAHTALLNARLALAVRRGCDLSCVTTAPGNASQRNVERLGFRMLFMVSEFTRRR